MTAAVTKARTGQVAKPAIFQGIQPDARKLLAISQLNYGVFAARYAAKRAYNAYMTRRVKFVLL